MIALDRGKNLLKITNLFVRSQEGKPLLQDINLTLYPGEVHALIGINGTGKSSLFHVVSGKQGYEVTSGNISFKGEALLEMTVDERARRGLFVAFQNPVAIPGLSNATFLLETLNERRRLKGEEALTLPAFLSFIQKRMDDLDMERSLLHRSVNSGFSGGERKRNELLQMIVLDPDVVLLDETDSGLDAKARHSLVALINRFRKEGKGVIIISHYQELLVALQPDRVHLMRRGGRMASGTLSSVETFFDASAPK